jgi:hypothetical protein
MPYSLDAKEVKKVIDAKLSGQPYDQTQFLFYHLYRNYFNVKDEVKTLKKIGEKSYKDNLGFVWAEVSTLKNYYHMPLSNWIGSMIGASTAYSRKFLRDDNITGIGGEFEMIIRNDGKRIDALTNEEFQETYNFGRTRNFSEHKKLDVDTHSENGKYTFKRDLGKVTIIELVQ